MTVGPLAPLTDGGLPAVGIWDVGTRQLVRRFDTDDYSAGALSPDGSLLFTFEDGPFQPNGTVWDVATGAKLRTFNELGGIIDGTFSPDGMIELQACQRLVRLPAAERDPYPVLNGVVESFEEGLDTPSLVDARQLLATPVQ